MKKFLKLLVVLLITLGVLGILSTNKNVYALWNANSLQVTTDESCTTDSVKIEFGISVNTINRENDLALFENRSKYNVIYDGEEEDCIANDYGENDFLLTYADHYYLSFRQFKFNSNHQHDYHFHFFKRNDSTMVEVKIEGKDDMWFERPMLLISEAKNYRCNVPVDSAGYIYNMIEFVK